MANLWHDLKHSLRSLFKNPGFTIAAVAALALGIGTNTAIFTVVNTVLLKPLTYPDADRIVQFLAHIARRQRSRRLSHQVQQLAAADQRLSGRHRLRLRWPRLQPHRRPPRAGPRHPRQRSLFPPLWRARHPGPQLHRAGRFAQRRQSCRHQLRAVAAQIRRQSQHRRQRAFAR